MTPGAPIRPFRPPAPRPEGITVVEDQEPEVEGAYRRAPGPSGRLVLRRSWFSKTLFFMAIFCVFWDGFMINWYSMLLGRTGPTGPTGPGLLFFLFPLIHVSVGVWLTYRTLAGFVNRTLITVADGAVTVHHGPLPWSGNRSLRAEEIAQLYCDPVAGGDDSKASSFNLSAMLRDGGKVVLLKGLPAADQALYLEQRIEERLGIPDSRVAGEYQSG